ncbi:DUF6522 family protein [Roseovarius salinarum]|uniref:DUF6522 family protein n=1 Tax=Roseovarius salinarum TaxID=1981892 RepID=UPI000C32B7EE|nr:DUF6522 family protein [Roseovarius salinarum]
MSDDTTRRRIRAQRSPADDTVMGFVLDAPVQAGASARFDDPETAEAPLARALFAVDGVREVDVSGATVRVRRDAGADWVALKPAVAAAIRGVLDETDAPLGTVAADGAEDDDADSVLLQRVEALLERQVNPAVAAHGGHIAVDRVQDATVYLRMSGGCQGCAASAATLRQGVERMLRAALPDIRDIVDVTDHAAGTNPFYTEGAGASPVLDRPVPPDAIGWEDGQIVVDPEYLAPRLGLTPETLREGLRRGDVVGVTEQGVGADAGSTRVVLRSPTRAWAAEVREDGSAREVPPPKSAEAAADRERRLSDRVRAHLAGLPAGETVTYGALARALGMWLPGSVRKVTGALEETMHEDARAGRPFIAARAVSRAGDGLPGNGFFETARALSRGPGGDEDARAFHRRELTHLEEKLAASPETPAGAGSASA